MRLFVALNLGEEEKIAIHNLQKKLKKLNILEGNYINKDELHLTLKFIGNIEDKYLDIIINKLKEVDFDIFYAELGLLGRFSCKILWIELLSEKIKYLANKINLSLLDIVLNEKTPFISHITIVRIKKIINMYKFDKFIKETKIEKISKKISYFSLVKSVFKDEKTCYITIADFLSKDYFKG